MLEKSIKIIMILLLAGIIGWDREQHGRPAGFRTHILVGIGSTIIMMVSIMMYEKFPGSDADPGRIAAQVVSGIGFLGAGTILIRGSTVKGLTTAASLWTTAAIGLAVGAGFYYTAIIGTLIVFFSLFFLSSIEFGRTKLIKQELTCKLAENNLDFYQTIYDRLEEQGCEIQTRSVKKDPINKIAIINIRLTGDCLSIKEFNSWLMEKEKINEFTWREVTSIYE